jgi:aryl-alcohol dehydrogenase-like predicted oxidoreductase
MKKIELGSAGAQVSRLCLGTMYFGSTVAEAASFSILDAYAGAGGSFLDTANKYVSWIEGFTGGESEALLGRWMKARCNRQEMFVATKVGLPMPGVEKGLRAAQIIAECEKSLARLGTDVIDLYYAHADDRDTPLEESLRAFDSLVQSGKVRFLGLSNYFTWRLKEALMVSELHRLAPIACIQMKYSCVHPRAGIPREFPVQVTADEQTLDFCAAHGLPMLAYSPLMGGVFGHADKKLPAAYDSEENRACIATIRMQAAEMNTSPNQIVLAGLMRLRNPSIIPILGVSSVEQLRDNLGSLNVSFADRTP